MISATKTVRLGDLDHDPVIMAMPGQEARLKSLDDLKASIPAKGLLQGLKVRIDEGGTRYLVTAGNRRLATLRALCDAGAAIRGETVTDEWQVPVILSEETDDDAREQAVAENVQRVALTPAAEARQFAELAVHAAPKEIAARFGVTEKRVRQRLKLAGLHPTLIKMLDDGKLSISAGEAFTVEPDQDRQLRALKKLSQWELNQPERIRDALTAKLVTAKSTIAKLIGAKAYKAAGGEVFEDEFTGEVYWISSELIETLLEAHWKTQIEQWQEDGWLFVEPFDVFSKKDGYGYRPSLYHFQQLKGGKSGFTKAQKAVSGVVYWPDGSDKPHFGLVRKGTKVNNDGSAIKKAKSATGDEPALLTVPGPSSAALLNDAMTKALREKVAAAPDLGLAIVVATMHARRCYYQYPPVHLTTEGLGLPDRVESDDAKHPWGVTFPETLRWAVAQPRDVLVAAIAELVAPLIDVRGQHPMPDENRRALIDIVDPDVAPHFEPAAYFATLTKPLIACAYREFNDHAIGDGKKGELVTAATAMLKDTGWLPPQLRSAGYTGPGGPPAQPESRRRHPAGGEVTSDDDEDEDFVDDEIDESTLQAAE